MKNNESRLGAVPRRPASIVRRLARKIVAILAECHYAQRRLTILTLAPDRSMPSSQHAPDTYSEFLARTSGPMLHEPSARARAAGRHAIR